MKHTTIWVHLILTLLMAIALPACSGATMAQQRRDAIIDCTKDLIGYDAGSSEAYSICRDLYTVHPPVSR